MKSHIAFATIFAASLLSCVKYGIAQNFIPTSGTHSWNVNANWSSDPSPFPNSNTAAVTFLPATATLPLTVNLGEPITVNSLSVNKTSSGANNTTIGEGTHTLTFDGASPTITNGVSTSTGQTTFNAPIAFTSTLQVNQNDINAISFNQSLTGGANGLTLNRGSTGAVVLGAANSYTGTTHFSNSQTNQNYLLVRLNDANAIPGGIDGIGNGTSNLLLTGSVIIGLSANDFKRGVGIGADQFRLANNSAVIGWAAFGQDRAVKVTTGVGTPDQLVWGTSGINLGTLILGHNQADKTIDMQNSLNLTTGTGSVGRTIRIANGSAAVDAIISGPIINTQGTANLTFAGATFSGVGADGTVSLTAANTYNGTTTISGGATVRLENAAALPSGNLSLATNGIVGLGLGNDTFNRALGTGSTQIQFASGGGFAAFGGNKTVNLGGAGADLTWGSGSGPFISAASNSLTLGDTNSDATVDFQNGLILSAAGVDHTILTPNGTATADGKVSGVISGGGNLRKNNPGTLELSNANSYTGTTRINAGTLLLTNATSIPGGIAGGNTNGIVFTNDVENPVPTLGLGQGDFTSELNSSAGAGQVNLNGSTSGTTTAGFAAYGADRIVNFKQSNVTQQVVWGSGGFVTGVLGFSDGDADAMVDLQNPIDLNGAARRVKVANGDANIDGTLSGVISGTAASFEKDGSGTLALTAANTYDGGTTVTGGRLLVNNSTGSGTGSGAVTVNSGTLGGTGIISGAVTVNTGAHIAPGASIESLDVGALALNAGSILDFELGAPGSPGVTSDLINVTTIDELQIFGGTVNITDAGGLAAGTYTLIDYLGTIGGDVEDMTLGTQPSGFSFDLENNFTNTSIDLVVSVVGVQGDYNNNGFVDAADYVLWRKDVTPLTNEVTGVTPGDTTPEDYDEWRARFGNPTPGGGGGVGGQQVPEPTTLVLLFLALPVFGHLIARNRG